MSVQEFDLAGMIVSMRAHAGLTQAQLAERCGMLQPAIGRLERGKRAPAVETLARIADACDCNLVLRFEPRGER